MLTTLESIAYDDEASNADQAHGLMFEHFEGRRINLLAERTVRDAASLEASSRGCGPLCAVRTALRSRKYESEVC